MKKIKFKSLTTPSASSSSPVSLNMALADAAKSPCEEFFRALSLSFLFLLAVCEACHMALPGLTPLLRSRSNSRSMSAYRFASQQTTIRIIGRQLRSGITTQIRAQGRHLRRAVPGQSWCQIQPPVSLSIVNKTEDITSAGRVCGDGSLNDVSRHQVNGQR